MNGRSRGTRGLRAALAGAALMTMSAQAAAQQEKAWGLQVASDTASAYWFRGIDMLAKGPVLVPHVTATFGGGFSAYWWGYRGELGDGGPDYFEHDFGVDYTFDGEKAFATLGALAYTYQDPEDLEDTTEVYVVAGLRTLLVPKLAVYYDFDLFDGAYASLAISHGFPLAEGLVLTPSAAYGHNFGWTERALLTSLSPTTSPNDLLFGLDLAWTRGSLAIHGAAQLSHALEALEGAGQEDFEVFTLGGSYSF